MDVNQIPQSGKHAFEIRLAQTKVSSQSFREDFLHGEQHQTMMLLREHKFIYMFLPLDFTLAMIDET